jgi:hypothetical protein
MIERFAPPSPEFGCGGGKMRSGGKRAQWSQSYFGMSGRCFAWKQSQRLRVDTVFKLN